MASLFFSYSHKDENLRNELETHLALLKRQAIITSWHDRRITAGSDLDNSISTQIEASQVILLLVSANFLSSDYCYEKEMNRALEKHKEGSAIVIPVILHPCDWLSAPFGHLRATPTDGKPVSMFANQHEAFAIIAKDVREAVTRISSAEMASHDNKKIILDPPFHEASSIRSSNLRVKRRFDDHERDEFLEDSFHYIARYFEGSLDELCTRNPHLKTRFKKQSESRFSAMVYDNGKRVAECSIWYGGRSFSTNGIAYSHSSNEQDNSLNESLSVVDDGYSLQLKPLGLHIYSDTGESLLSQQGAAENYWSLFISSLQR